MSFLLPITIATLVAVAMTFVMRRVALRLKIVDAPDGKRKCHRGPTPLWGGVAVYLALIAGLFTALLHQDIALERREFLSALTLVAGLVCLTGCIDDAFHLRAGKKLLLQIVSVCPIVAMGYCVDNVVAFGYNINLGWFGVPLTVLWLLGCINALNLIDGMDGLASVVGLSAALMIALIAANLGNGYVSVIALTLAGALAGFLVFNRPPASIFLGDSGSMVIGLTLGLLGIQGSMKTSATLAITAPVVVMTLPMFDTVAAIIRRRLTGRSFASADREHIHHRLLDRGLTPWQVLCVIATLTIATGAAATAATIFRKDALAWIVVVTLIVVMIRLKFFGHHEWALLYRSLRSAIDSVLRSRNASAEPAAMEMAPLEKCALPEAWERLIESLMPWKVDRMALSLQNGAFFGERTWHRKGWRGSPGWSMRVSIRQFDRLLELRLETAEKPAREKFSAAIRQRLMEFGDEVLLKSDDAEILSLMEEVHLRLPRGKTARRRAA